MSDNPSPGRHRRRRANRSARAPLDEARRAGLVQRHLMKLRHLDERAGAATEPATSLPAADPAPPDGGAPPSTAEAA